MWINFRWITKNGKETIISFTRDAYLLARVGSSQTSCELDTVLVVNKTKTRVSMQLFSSMYRKIDELTKPDHDECYKENRVDDAGEHWFPGCWGGGGVELGYILDLSRHSAK